jgi:hypothetical protein
MPYLKSGPVPYSRTQMFPPTTMAVTNGARSYRGRVSVPPPGPRNMVVTRRGMYGLGGAADCGAGQIWDPNFVYGTLPPGQCVTAAQSTANQTANPSQYDGSGSGVASVANSALQAFASIFGAKPAVGVPVASGMSTTTMVALAGAAVLAFALIMKKSS